MFDLWVRDTEITVLIAASAILIVFPLQLVLCFRAKKLLFKLLPTVLLAVAALAFWVLMLTARDWSALIYLIFTVFSVALLIFSGIGWSIWGISRFVKRKRN